MAMGDAVVANYERQSQIEQSHKSSVRASSDRSGPKKLKRRARISVHPLADFNRCLVDPGSDRQVTDDV